MPTGQNRPDSIGAGVRRYFDVPEVPRSKEITIGSEQGSDAVDLAPEGDGPVELEIGFGKGRFLLERAENNPRTRFIGLETRRKLVDLVLSRAAKRGLKNVKVWLGDARSAMRRIKKGECVSRVFINFPDPWWKARHAKRIVLTPESAACIAGLLTKGGELFVQTDVDFRMRLYRDTLLSNENLAPVSGDGTILQNPFDARSVREVKCEESGLPIYRLFFRRKK